MDIYLALEDCDSCCCHTDKVCSQLHARNQTFSEGGLTAAKVGKG